MAAVARSADPKETRQYHGHVRHQEHLKEQKEAQMERRAARIKARRKH